VITACRQVSRHNREAGQADELILQLLDACGIQIWRPLGERRWTYANGRHRARALMDAGVRRIVVTSEDDWRYRD
jgi:hypothetical protein